MKTLLPSAQTKVSVLLATGYEALLANAALWDGFEMSDGKDVGEDVAPG